jgi:transposase
MVSSWNRLTPNMGNEDGIRPVIRYSEAFKREVVRQLEREGLSYAAVRQKYGITGNATVQVWVRKYGNGLRGRMVRVETPEEMRQLKSLKERVRQLESALADANIDLGLERAYTRMACEQAGIQDVEEFKKKAAGKPHTKP